MSSEFGIVFAIDLVRSNRSAPSPFVLVEEPQGGVVVFSALSSSGRDHEDLSTEARSNGFGPVKAAGYLTGSDKDGSITVWVPEVGPPHAQIRSVLAIQRQLPQGTDVKGELLRH